MRSLRVILFVAVSIALGVVGVAPASAAKAPLSTPQITSAVALDTRTHRRDVDGGEGSRPLRAVLGGG